jgi:NhaP-type Na+/H+ and K+/H+ antiporter
VSTSRLIVWIGIACVVAGIALAALAESDTAKLVGALLLIVGLLIEFGGGLRTAVSRVREFVAAMRPPTSGS